MAEDRFMDSTIENPAFIQFSFTPHLQCFLLTLLGALLSLKGTFHFISKLVLKLNYSERLLLPRFSALRGFRGPFSFRPAGGRVGSGGGSGRAPGVIVVVDDVLRCLNDLASCPMMALPF